MIGASETESVVKICNAYHNILRPGRIIIIAVFATSHNARDERRAYNVRQKSIRLLPVRSILKGYRLSRLI